MKTGLTKNSIKILLVITLIITFSSTTDVFANDGVLGTTPEGIYPITQSDITMEAEEIIIKMVSFSEAEVTCRFDFKNYGDAQTVLIGFPARLAEEVTEFSTEDDISLRDFTARDENGVLPVTLVDTIPNPPLSDISHMSKYAKWYSFSVDFDKNGKKTLYHTYKVSFPYYSTGDIYTGYVLETGALWHGTIGHSKVVFDLGEHPIYSVTAVYPNNFFRIEGNKLIFERKNFKPSYNLRVNINGYHYSEGWIEMLKESEQTEEIDMIHKRIEFFTVKPEEIRKDNVLYLQQYEELIKDDPVKALYLKSALGLPDGSEKPQIVDYVITNKQQGNWSFDFYGTDPDMDIVSYDAEIHGIEDDLYDLHLDSDFHRESVYFDHTEKRFRGRGYLNTSASEPFSITLMMTDAQGNMDFETIILNTKTNEPDPTTMPNSERAQTTSLTTAREANANANPDYSDNASVPVNHSNDGIASNKPTGAGRLIHTEEETVPMLITGVLIVLVAFLAVVILLLFKRKNLGYLLFIGQIGCLAVGLYKVVGLLTARYDSIAMASENISLGIGLTALFWAISMLFMVGGIILTGKKHPTDILKS